ncbi:MAG: DUF3500 domain-containing protein [Acidobacteria bacterium]|nr:DUF3500 domain-containing protein [Acidobacteriota bacterium]
MKQKRMIIGLCFLVLLPAGWGLRAAQQRTQKINAAPAPPLRAVPAKESDVTGKTVAAAKAFLATLNEAERAKVSFAFDSDQKVKWSNFPSGIFQRNGLRWGDLNATQRESLMKLLAAALSKPGLQKVKEIMEGDEVLKTSGMGPRGGRPGGPPGGGPPGGQGPGRGGRGPGGPGGLIFGRDEYYIAFLGAPSLTDPWMIQFGGHHLAINVTVIGKSNVLAPSLPAVQPATYKLNGETVRPLGREYEKGFVLINALDAAQQTQAILPYQVSNLVLGPGEDGKTIQPEGIKVSALNAAQKEKLLDIVNEWVGILNDEAAAAKMAEIKATLNETWFAWSGPTTPGSAAYYRIQGPTLLIEFAPQGGDTEHIHTIYRDPTNDYGARLTKR